ncbi:MAG TPA: maleylacetoacetate isomerase [Bdellovibrio sp.]|nr:maleylacetoacetate isomerase [Bdellovibrio sp.]
MSSLILYNYFRSSTSFRARAALNLKNLDYEYRPINLLKGEQNGPEYRKLNPLGGVPTLVHNGKIIPDSTAIIEYLEEIAPTPSLLPQDTYLKARVRQVCEIVNSSMHPYGNLKITQYLTDVHGFTPEQKEKWFHKWLGQGLEALEKTLSEFAGLYCFGNEVTMADLYVYPQVITCQRFHVDLSSYSTVMKIYENCHQHPAFQKAHLSRQMDTPPEMRG